VIETYLRVTKLVALEVEIAFAAKTMDEKA
jgi:hypothetical protein